MIKRATGKGPLEARVEAFTEPHLSEVVEAAKKPKIQYVGETALQTGISSSTHKSHFEAIFLLERSLFITP